jgi:hypothetical protein
MEAASRLLEDPRVAAVLVPLRPTGEGALARAARRYVAAWDRRLLHRQNLFVPGARVVARAPLPGWRAADAAPELARAVDAGADVEPLPAGAVLTPIARDLGGWIAWAREEGAAWGALAAREARFRPFVPTEGWWIHNVARSHRRVGEAAQAMRRADPLAALLHVTREAAWSGACLRAYRARL